MGGMKNHLLNVATALGIGAIAGLSGCGEAGEDPASEIREAQENPSAAAAPSGAPVVVASLAWDIPGSWDSRPTDGVMRKAEFGVGEDATLVFFHFGPGQGGSAEDNLARWARVMLDENGEPVHPEIEVVEAGAFRTVTASYAGTYMSGRPGGDKTAQEGWALLGAVVEDGPEGSVFLRLTGPAPSVEGVRDEWRAMIESVRGAGL